MFKKTAQLVRDGFPNSNGNGNGSNDGNDKNDVAQGKPKPEATMPASSKHFWPMGKQSFAPGVNVAFSPHMYNVQTNKIPNVPSLVLVLEGRHSNGNKDCEVARGKVWPGGLQWFTT